MVGRGKDGATVTAPVDHEATIQDLVGRLDTALNNNDLLEESIADLQLAIDDLGWRRIIAAGMQEFTRDGLRQITAACRLFALKNPLIKRGLLLRQVYVWGQGVEVTARANGRSDHAGEQDVNAVIQAFLDDPDNRRALTGSSAQTRHERSLGSDGNLFLAMWTKPTTGRVQARVVPWEEITNVICNPQDRSEPWYYERQWTEDALDVTSGGIQTTLRRAFYPAIGYRPAVARPSTIGGVEVRWDAPVRHVKVNDPEGWRFGVPDAYAAVDWARAYKEFLEDWAKLCRALSRYAWKATTPGNKAAAVKTRIATAPGRDNLTGLPLDAGGTAIMAPDVTLEAISKTGATIDSESGRPLAMMVAAALGVPVTMLLADPGLTGARATAETLDQPTELEMTERRGLWTEVLRDLCEYVVRESVRAPKGVLKGVIGRDEYGRETVTLAGDTVQTIDVAWPDLKDLDPLAVVTAVVAAASTMTVPPEITLRLLLTALGVHNVDELVDEMVDADGNFQWPSAPAIGGAGPAAAAAVLAGQDPAAVDGGPMAGETPPPDSQPGP